MLVVANKFGSCCSRITGYRRFLHFDAVKKCKKRRALFQLKNNITTDQSLPTYTEESWQTLISQVLTRDTMYVYVDKAKLDQNAIYPGHILSFMTDDQGIMEDSCLSLRNGQIYSGKLLEYTLQNKITQRGYVYGIRFWNLKDDFGKFFFGKANAKGSLDLRRQRYLIGLPLDGFSKEAILERIGCVKSEYQNKDYILHGGKVNGQKVGARNCVNGFYSGMNVVGTESNPSPQMALWSYLRFIWGIEEREDFIAETKLREHQIERTHDDMLIRAQIPNTIYPTSGSGTIPTSEKSKRHFSTRAFQNGTNVDVDDWESLWIKFSEDEKLQNALIIDQPLTAEMAYYKGQALNRMGLEYAEDAIRAYRDGTEMSTGGNNEWRSKLEQEIKILEQLLDRQETKSEANLQDYVDHEFDEIFRDLEEQHRLQVKGLQRRREMILAYVKNHTSQTS